MGGGAQRHQQASSHVDTPKRFSKTRSILAHSASRPDDNGCDDALRISSTKPPSTSGIVFKKPSTATTSTMSSYSVAEVSSGQRRSPSSCTSNDVGSVLVDDATLDAVEEAVENTVDDANGDIVDDRGGSVVTIGHLYVSDDTVVDVASVVDE